MTPQLATEWSDEIKNPPLSALDYPANDSGNAMRFIHFAGAKLRYVPEWEQWIIWNGHHWRPDNDGAVYRLAEDHEAEILRDAAEVPDIDSRQRVAKLALQLGKRATIENLLALARFNEKVILHAEKLDADPWLLGVRNGVLELKTGRFRNGNPQDFITKTTGCDFDPTAKCPQFDSFLFKIMDGNREMVSYLWRIFGYLLTGATSEQCLFFLYGAGRNGKSTLIETTAALMGNYAAATVVELITENRQGREPSQLIAALRGLRLAHLPETEEGHVVAQARLKTLTGGDRLVGRALYQKEFQFNNTAKLFIHGNSKPEIRGVDLGIWRRFRLIPFVVTIPPDEVDYGLSQKLLAELPGILNRSIEGCLAWQRGGLNTPPIVEAATQEYRENEDVIGEFLLERTRSSPTGEVPKRELYLNYIDWCELQKQRPFSKKRFASLMAQRGLRERRTDAIRFWQGLVIK